MGKGKYQKKTSKKPIGLLCVAALITAVSCGVAFGMNSRSDSSMNTEIKTKETKSSEIMLETVAPSQSISDIRLPDLFTPSLEPIYATYVSTVSAEYGSRSAQSSMTLEAGANQKEVFRKQFELGANRARVISARLEEVNNAIYLKIDISDMEDGFAFKSKTFSVMSPQMKSKCYIIAQKEHIIVIEKYEKNSGWYDGYSYLAYDPTTGHSSLHDYWGYSETVSVYDITDSLEKVLDIKREIDPYPETEMCKIKQGNNSWIYASGYDSVTSEGSIFLSTEQDFCDKANELLAQYISSTVNCTRTSWDNRWFRMEIDESEIPNNMFKVDAVSTYGILSSEDTVTSEIEFTFNVKETDPGELTDEGEDYVVTYTKPEEQPVSPILPANIPKSVDVEQLQELANFNINGFWQSTDGEYVYQIFTSPYDSGINSTLRYVDLDGSDEVKRGKVIQTSSYSVNLKANEDRGARFEVFAVNDRLVSDDITFIRTDDYVSNRLLGTWKNDDWSYTFEADGTYNVDRARGDSYWGYYFVIDNSRIVMSEHASESRLRDYRIDDTGLWIDNMNVLIRS